MEQLPSAGYLAAAVANGDVAGDAAVGDIDRSAAGGQRGVLQNRPRGGYRPVDAGTYGMRMAALMHLESAPFITVSKLRNSLLAVTRLRSGARLTGRSTPNPPEPAHLVSLHLHAAAAAELWYGGRPQPVGSLRPEGGVSIIDLSREPAVYIGSAFDMVQFYVPRRALDDIAYDQGARRIDNLSWPFGHVDPLALRMAAAILPALERPDRVDNLYIDYIVLGLISYFAHAYGGMRRAANAALGGLAPWQERRAKEFIDAHLDGAISVAELAVECKLSISHFARAFRHTTGSTPHRWLLERRIQVAKDLLLKSDLPLGQVALACGFSDQSHLTRIFCRIDGISPGAWRRAQRL